MADFNIKVKPILYTENRDLWIFTGEVNQMTVSEIQDGIDSCNLAFDGKHEEMSWGLEVFELLISKEMSTLEYHGDFVAEIPTIDILAMLTEYKEALDYFENKEAKSNKNTQMLKTQFKNVTNYHLHDGVKEVEINKVYDNWLSSLEHSTYSKSFIKINNETINLFGNNTEKATSFFSSNKQLGKDLAEEFQLVVEENQSDYVVYNKKHKSDSYYVVSEKINNEKYLVVYSLGGSRFVESITIYGVVVYI